MWHVCNPKSDDDLKQCAELGKSLSRMSQPTILTLLACSDKPLCSGIGCAEGGRVSLGRIANTIIS